MSAQEDKQVLRQDTSPLIGESLSVLCLRAEYADNANSAVFAQGIDYLHRHYDAMRRVRGDGNCFFRALIYALCEQLLPSTAREILEHQQERKSIDLTTQTAHDRAFSERLEDSIERIDHTCVAATAAATSSLLTAHIQQKIRRSKAELVALGYSETAIDTFWETFMDYLVTLTMHFSVFTVQDFQTEGGESEYLVWYARLLTAGYLKQHAERFRPFIAGLCPGQTVEQFCSAEVEPMGKECDQPQIMALAEALDICVRIEYLDGRASLGSDLPHYICRSSSRESTSIQGKADPDASEAATSPANPTITIHLLYRPGHYDILYPRLR
uniref:Ubiquitin thioesterase otubain putative n=1 Tax=Albugo laibachii Nc14 TaxID=890382 RepID=F0WCC7_9STRA|nr:ubiquitin thioesterase otubain putative [Albugo laibachii Nc14]|eukprot:CCA18842.1 ubiquitin thioesterase otubain putative [Albugo laibachii Nc14]